MVEGWCDGLNSEHTDTLIARSGTPTVSDRASMNGDGGAAGARPAVHKVPAPSKRSVSKQARSAVRELFFYNVRGNWFQQAGLSRPQQAFAALKSLFPILDWIFTYSPRLFFHDLVAGFTIASLAIPQDLGYASLSGIPRIYGLYTSFVPPLVHALLGTSRNIAIGPVAVVSLLMGVLMKQELDPTADAADYLRLAFTSTFFAGVFQAAMGILRLGFIIDYLSHAAIVGFMGGAAITIALQQLRGLFNIKSASFSKNSDIVAVLKSVFTHTEQWSWRTIVMTLAFMAFLTSTKLLAKKKPKFFWVAAIAPLTSMIIATAAVYGTRVDKKGVQIAGYIKKGINPSSVHELLFSGPLLGPSMKIGLIAGLVAMTEGLAIGRTFAKLGEHLVDGNKEMMAFGFMNICGSLSSCYVATGSFSRSALNYASGGRTPMANVVMAILVAMVLIVLTPLIHYTPICILSAVVIVAVLPIIDLPAAYFLYKVDIVDFLTCLSAFFGTLFISVEIGLLIAISMSFAKILYNVTRPHTAILGNILGTRVYQDTGYYHDAMRMPGIVAIMIDSAICFSNASYIKDKIMKHLEEEKQNLENTTDPKVHYLILDLAAVSNIDVNGVLVIEEIKKDLKKQDIQLAISNPRASLMEKLHSSNFISHLGIEWIFMSIDEAVQVCSTLRNQENV